MITLNHNCCVIIIIIYYVFESELSYCIISYSWFPSAFPCTNERNLSAHRFLLQIFFSTGSECISQRVYKQLTQAKNGQCVAKGQQCANNALHVCANHSMCAVLVPCTLYSKLLFHMLFRLFAMSEWD